MRKKSEVKGLVIIYVILSVGLIFMAFPYVWMVLASFKIPSEIYSRFFPTRFTLEHYKMVFAGGTSGLQNPFIKSIFNSLVVSTTATVSVVFFGAITGYALARLQFRGRNFLNHFILFQMLFPAILFLIPRFLLMLSLQSINTYQGMFLPFLMNAWAIFLFTQFFKAIPQELIDAARIDGCSELRIVFRIMVPLSKSVTAIVAIFTFMTMWDEFLWYLIVTKDYDLMPLSVLLGLFTKGEYSSYPGIQTAGATLLTLPILALFFLFRRYFSEGITMTGLKG
ncbi:MAG: carbohydrate ABC transporter permease [Calditrichia bacterium]|nr:carbohydrate ABC transporter permease [Calditrichia bacterium]